MRQNWNSKLSFILAAVGSAVGLGNLWRFPYTAATHGGGAFILPYLIAIITAGIPILIMEYTLGKAFKSGAPGVFMKINTRFEWLGWFQCAISFLITVYYFALVVWTMSYIGFSITTAWEGNPSFFTDYLGLTDGISDFGTFRTRMLVPFLLAWFITGWILYKGINKGIDIACRICLPMLFFCIVVMFIRGITLPGAVEGLAYMFTPDWKALGRADVWIAAYGQVFFSLSIAFAVLIGYASYLPDDEDVVNTAFLTATANHGVEIFAGIAIFSIIGYMANLQGVSVEEVGSLSGVMLAFDTFPVVISALPGMNGFFGVLFFMALLTAGISSLVSIPQAIITSVEDKFDVSHTRATSYVVIPAFIVSFLFIFGNGLYTLDIADYLANNVCLTFSGVAEIVLVLWVARKGDDIRAAANSTSNFAVGGWWKYALSIVTVIILTYSFVVTAYDYFFVSHYGYPLWIGILILGLMVGFTVILSRMKGRVCYYEY